MFKNKRFTVPVLIIAAFLVFFSICFAKANTSGKIQTGVRAGGISLSGLTTEEAEKKLSESCDDSVFEKTFTIHFGDVKKEVCPLDFLAEYDFKSTADKAQAACKGKSTLGSAFKIMGAFLFHKDLPMELLYDEEEFDIILKELMADIGDTVTEYSFKAEDDKLIVTTGSPGNMPDKKTVADEVLNAIRYNKEPDIVFKKELREPREVNVDHLYEQVYAEAADSEYFIENGKVVLTPHVVGMKFDKKEAEEIIEKNKGYNKTFVIPLDVDMPQVLTEDIEKKLFSEIVAEYTTKYNTADVSRSKNISLASNKINGTILAPGAVFSYNDTVGERSYSEGFETAHVYVNGEVVDGVGGGICQVSSTLYNAVLYANLEIVTRTNHQLTVSYVPLGRDATVDYGNIDLKFRNNLSYPVKIISSADSGTMYIAIYGYKEDKGLKVTLESETIGTKPPKEKKVDDPALPKGEEKVVEAGSLGYIVDTYRIVTRNGEEPVRTYLGRSNYEGSMKIINVGTGEPKKEPKPSEDPNKIPNELPKEEPKEEPESVFPSASPDPSPTASITPPPESGQETSGEI